VGGEGALHLLLAEAEAVAEDAGAAEAGAARPEVDAAPAAAQTGVDRHRGGIVGPVADGQLEAVGAGLGGQLRGRVFDRTLFAFAGFFFAEPFFVFFAGFFFEGPLVGADFGFLGFVFFGGGQDRGRGDGQAQRLRRNGDQAEGEQSGEQAERELPHRPTIGVSAVPL